MQKLSKLSGQTMRILLDPISQLPWRLRTMNFKWNLLPNKKGQSEPLWPYISNLAHI